MKARNDILRKRRGSAYVLAIVLVAMMVSLSAAMIVETSGNAFMGRNLADVQAARFLTDSGLGFAARQLAGLSLPSNTDDTNVIANLADRLGQRLNGTTNLGGASVTQTATTVRVPAIAGPDGTFQVFIVQDASLKLWLESHGSSRGARRMAAVQLAVVPGHPNSAFNYGIAGQGAISIGGTARIRGKNALTDASIISATPGPSAVTVSGNAIVDGDVSSVGASTTVTISGSPTIAGSQDPAVIAQHVHFGVEPPVFPEVDTSIFRALTTSVIDSGTDTSQHGQVFNNVLIKANANPTFSSDVVLNGIVFIEVPNKVTFTSKVTLNGLVATEQKPGSIDDCKLSFGGQVDAFGVEALPAGPTFDAVKQQTGTFIVAPGFDVSFAGQFTTINGTIAADRLTFSGQASGTVKGSVIGLANYPTSINGTVDIYIDRSSDGTPPGGGTADAGFKMPCSLVLKPETYQEMSAQ